MIAEEAFIEHCLKPNDGATICHRMAIKNEQNTNCKVIYKKNSIEQKRNTE